MTKDFTWAKQSETTANNLKKYFLDINRPFPKEGGVFVRLCKDIVELRPDYCVHDWGAVRKRCVARGEKVPLSSVLLRSRRNKVENMEKATCTKLIPIRKENYVDGSSWGALSADLGVERLIEKANYQVERNNVKSGKLLSDWKVRTKFF